MTTTLEELFEAFRVVEKPESAKGCSQGCCMEDDEVTALLNADQRSLTMKQLMPYLDGAFVTLSNVPEFTYLLPGMLKVWAEELFVNNYESAFTQFFHAALGRRYEGVAKLTPSFIVTQLTPLLRETVVRFMHQALLCRIGSENTLLVQGMSPTHLWFSVFAAYGVLVPDVQAVWEQWWAFPSSGHAIAAIQYASCLICGRNDNPIFASWDRKRGGGPPCLWEYDALVDEDWCWLPENMEFLRRTLSLPYLTQKLTDAATHLPGPVDRDTVAALQRTLSGDPTMVELRIDQLMEMLTTANSRVRLERSFEDR